MGNWVTEATLWIEQVNLENSTISGTYGMLVHNGTSPSGTMSKFPFHGEFDPTGVTVGWIISFRNESVNQHALGSWSGYYSCDGGYPKNYLHMTKLITYQAYYNTTTGTEIFKLTQT